MPTISPTDFMQPANYTFDVGGVDFDGLEMLQGFNNDFASLWQTLIPDASGQYDPAGALAGASAPTSSHIPLGAARPSHPMIAGRIDTGPTIGAVAGQGHTVPSTPELAGNAGWMPSPHQVRGAASVGVAGGPSGFGAEGQGQGQAHGGIYGVLPDLGSSEFWSQIAAAGQDWEADPNVPFNF
jgi:hypothetical protein